LIELWDDVYKKKIMVDTVPTKWMKTIIVYILLLPIYDRVEIQIPYDLPIWLFQKAAQKEKNSSIRINTTTLKVAISL